MNRNRKGLLMKILLMIGLPVAITYCVVAVITLQTASQSVSSLTTAQLSARSEAASNEIGGIFNDYREIAKQMAANAEFYDLFTATVPGNDLTTMPGYAHAVRSLINAQQTNADNILAAWMVDVDTSKLAQSDAFVSNSDWNVQKRPWFIQMAAEKDVIISDPYIDTASGLTVVSAAAPVFKTGTDEIIGALGIDFQLDNISAMISEYKLGETGFYTLVSNNGQIIYHPNQNYKNVNIAEIDASDNLKDAVINKTEGAIEYTNGEETEFGHVSVIDNIGWVVATGLPEPEYAKDYNAVRNTLFGVYVIALLIVLGLIIFTARHIVKPIKVLAVAAEKMALGDMSVSIDTENASRDEIGELTVAFSAMTDNIREQAMAAAMIAQGNLDQKLTIRSADDILALSMTSVVETLKKLVEEADNLTNAAVAGNLSVRGNADQFSGGYQEIIHGFNKTLDAVINPLNMVAEQVDRISKGDIPDLITDHYSGDFDSIKDNLNSCIKAVGSLVEDTRMLADAAISGDFERRADEDRHNGDFKTVIAGVNQTLDAVVDKAFWYQAIIDAIPFPLHVTDMDMKWTLFNTAFEKVMIDQGVAKNRDQAYGMDCYNADATICRTEGCGIHSLVTRGETESYFDWAGKSQKQDTAYLKDRHGNNIGFVEVVTDLTGIIRVSDYTKNEVKRLASNLVLLSTGNLKFDMEIAAADEFTQEVSKQFEEINESLAAVKSAVGVLINDATLMTKAAVGGDLSNRADLTKHGGEFAKIMGGFNATLDAVTAPIEEASSVLQEMAKGNLQISMQGDYHGDHAAIKDAMNETLTNLRTYVSDISRVLADVGEGNLNQEITANYRGDFVEIKNSLNNIVSSLSQVMGEIRQAANQVASGSRQVSDGSQALSQGSTEQASTLEELTASITEIANQTKQNAVNANKANELASTAKASGAKGNEQMRGMLASMEEINESSKNISRIIKVIDDIAFQTNILALNAAVEAARAGQHGKGFAVVAEEVRNLAARSAEAAKETTALIEGSIQKVDMGTKLANATADALHEISEGLEESAVLVGNIATASNEQASGIAQINMGIEQVSQVVQNNSATAQQSAATSEELSGQAELLNVMVGRFKLKSDQQTGITGSVRTEKKKEAPPVKTAALPKNTIKLDDSEFDKY